MKLINPYTHPFIDSKYDFITSVIFPHAKLIFNYMDRELWTTVTIRSWRVGQPIYADLRIVHCPDYWS